jgi:hypothetical protein
VTDNAATPSPDPEVQLPPRDARSLFVHFAVDAAVIFLAVILVLFFLDVSVWVVAIVAVILGAVAAPFTRRAEERGLSRRYTTGGGSPAD